MEQILSDDKWEVLKSMYTESGLVRQHLHSFNEFVENKLNEIVQERPKIEPDIEGFYVKLEGIEVGEPSVREADGSERTIYPMEARIRNLIYSAPLNLKMRPVYVDAGIEKEEEVVVAYIGRLPIMLKSKSCLLNNLSREELTRLGEDPEDPGGYFIINGSERVIVTQEYLVSNRVLVDEGRKGSSTTAVAKVFSTVAGFRSLVSVQRRKDGRLLVNFFSVPRPLPLAVLIKALGVTIDREIANLVTNDPDLIQELLPTLREAAEIVDQEEALDFIGKRVAVGQTRQYRILRAKQVLDNYLLPHVGKDESFRHQKALYLAQMALKVIELNLGRIEPDDKDHYANKRLKLAGEMLTSLFRVAFHSLYRDIKYQLEKGARRGKLPNLRVAMRADVITERIRHALATGNWVGGKAGVSQLLDRTNYMSTYSHLRRVISPLIRSQAHFEARDLHATHWGKICVHPDTNVLLGDGASQIPIDDIKNKFNRFSVTTIDKKSHEQIPSRIVAYQRISAYELGKNVLEIKTITGRKILATEDHPFLTNRGWIPAGNLRLTDKVLILPTLDPNSEIEETDRGVFTILTSDDFESKSDQVELERLGLLPLESDHPKLNVISRLLGIILTDGYVGKTVEFYLGSETDAKNICRDLEFLGFSTNPIKYKESSHIFNGTEDLITYGTYQTNKGGAFLRLMVALGAPVGKRTTQEYIFPMWLLNSPKKTKREFLASFMGGDGSAPWLYTRTGSGDSYKIRIPNIEIHKQTDLAGSLIEFFEQIEKMFNEFNVKVNHIKTKKTKQNDRIAVNIVFNASKDNIMNLCHNIGYRYCQEKQNKSQLIGEFLAYRKNQLNKRKNDREKVINLYDQGLQAKQIAEDLNLGYRVVTSIIQRRGQERSVVHPKSAWSAGYFMKETSADLDTGMLYSPLASIQLTDKDIVCDFTTEKDTHSFVANGFVTHNCPNETPEGPNCGLVKNLAMQAYISIGVPEQPVRDFIFQNCNVQPVTETIDHQGVHILLNGNLIATTRHSEETFNLIREARRSSKLNHEINLAYFEENRVISINTDGGRVRRPLIILDQVTEGSKRLAIPRLKKIHIEKLKRGDIKFSDLLKEGVIEFLDAEEEENAYIAMTLDEIQPEHTHVEISPSAILGICASIIPYAEHNQSPRNTYEAGMTKQALGLYASNFYFRTDRRSHILQAPQIPLVGSKSMDVIGFNDRPAGQNFIVAILSFQGYNIEDAIILNRASIERGLARSHFFRSYVGEEKKYLGGQEDRFEIPQKGVRGYRAKEVYRHLSEVDGIIEPEIEVGGGDILVGRTSRPRFLEEYIELESLESSTPQRRETSVAIRHGEKGIVDGVILTETSEGSTLVKIKVRDQRVPELGDKFASRHGQKGIIGHIVPQRDMPFTETGIVPDLIINPHAIPSRMTLGQIIECMSAIVACYEGNQIDATLFEAPDPEDIAQQLRKLGFHPYAESVMYDGMTGQKLPARIFIGPTYYQKLHHLVADKIHARARGPIQILTRQPTEGRAREGGLRFGEMERDCLIGHGAALLLKERLLEESDKTEIFICEKCGLIATWDRKKDQTYCSVCGNVDTGIFKIAVSYAFKLLLQELMSLTIKPQLILTDSTH